MNHAHLCTISIEVRSLNIKIKCVLSLHDVQLVML